MPVDSKEPESCGKQCACRTHLINRRDFLTLSGAVALGGALNQTPVMAGPMLPTGQGETPDFAQLIPPDKKLRPAWVAALFARGEPTVYSKKRNELRYIGMPVGGICCGTVYLGGDGRLWNWDIFNVNQEGVLPRSVVWDGFGEERTVPPRDGASYVSPHLEQSPFDQGFAVKIDGHVRSFDHTGWDEITFRGEYPLGIVRYTDPVCPVAVEMTAYSPFIPLDADRSGIPVVLCEFTLTNHGTASVAAEIGGWLQNAARLTTGTDVPGQRRNSAVQVSNATVLKCAFVPAPAPSGEIRPDVPVEDFHHEGYGRWTTTGTAFGTGPVRKSQVPSYQGDLGGPGDWVVNSHAAAPGDDAPTRDKATGTLTSPPFAIERKFLEFYIGGGSEIEHVGLAVVVGGKSVARAAGRNENTMRRVLLDVSAYHGQDATILIYDNATGDWGNIGVSQIVQTDQVVTQADGDDGTMALMLLGEGTVKADAQPAAIFEAPAAATAQAASDAKLTGAITAPMHLAPGQSKTVTFAVTWHFPNSRLNVKDAASGNYYARRFQDAADVARLIAREYPALRDATRLWHRTWHNSTLPHWFLERTFVNTSILATMTAHRFATGRFWAWEGVGCCEGTCTHVWHYAQAPGRIFPELERIVRERIDLGIALDQATGMIGYRGEGTGPAVDGQCGRVIGTYREHQMSSDDAFLRRVWPHAKQAVQFLMNHDGDGDGLIDGPQENTLDDTWYGSIPWINSLYAAALRAGEEMAAEVGDPEFGAVCRQKFLVTKNAIETRLFDGEYFIHLPDPAHTDSLGTYRGCHIDQVQGQSWAWQVGLGRVLDHAKTKSALRSLYKYNFAPDVGRFRAKNTEGRPYALAGDGGLIMVTNPRGLPDPFGVKGWQFQYFNECMTGFEHQVASHMIAEGMLLEGLAVTRAVHDRYHASLRNPYNEIECSDHYSRAMASYGSFVTTCGFEYHGPKGHLAFAPRITPERFKAAFTSAEGWGSYEQAITGETFTASVAVHHGKLRLTRVTLAPGGASGAVAATVDGTPLAVTHRLDENGRLEIVFAPVVIPAGQRLEIAVGA